MNMKPTVKRAISAPPIKRNALTKMLTGGAGGVDEDMFTQSFEDVARIQIFTSKDLETEMNKIKETLGDPSIDWQRRIDSMKNLRAILIAGGANYDEFFILFKTLELPFQISVKDLRSQVVREACITISYLSQRLGHKCDRFMELLLPNLINLIPNSAKIMSTSADVSIGFIIQHTHNPRFIPIITYNLSSKAKEIRRACCDYLYRLLEIWPTHTLEKNLPTLQEAVKKGLNDADSEARSYARKAFTAFANHFKEQADSIYKSLDVHKQKMIQGGSLVQYPSNALHSLPPTSRMPSRGSSSVSSSCSVENLTRPSSSMTGNLRNRSGIPIYSPKHESNVTSRTLPSPFRSTSAIDVGAAKRARARAAITNPKIPAGYSLPRPGCKSGENLGAIKSPERISRSRPRVSQSQPSSRSTSPSSRMNYHSPIYVDGKGMRVRRRSGIPLSMSREASPTRLNQTGAYAAMERRLSNGGRPKLFNTSTEKPLSAPYMAHKILQQSQEAEKLLHDALDSSNVTTRRNFRNGGDHSDESETSSVCSDRSFGSFGGRNIEDISEVILNLSSSHWSDRKESLLALQFFLRNSSRNLNVYELKRITDIFTKMLADPHTKTFSLFLDILNDLITMYKDDLYNWLPILLTKLFLKTGADTLGSIHNKILKTLNLIRESFNCKEQFRDLTKFLSDQTQTPNVKVKISVLQYLSKLIQQFERPSYYNDWHADKPHELQLAFMKLISWTADPKSQEIRKYSHDVILELFNANSSEFYAVINQLPKTYQDAAYQIVNIKRRDSSSITPQNSFSFLTNSNLLMRSCNAKIGNIDFDDTENLNPEDVYHAMRQTTEEIQKTYSYTDTTDLFMTSPPSFINTTHITKIDRSPAASPKKMSLGNRSYKDIPIPGSRDSSVSKLDQTLINNHNNTTKISISSNGSPTTNTSTNGLHHNSFTGDRGFTNVFASLKDGSEDVDFQKDALNELIELIRDGSFTDWSKHFNDALKILLEKISSEKEKSSIIRAYSLRVMCELLIKQTDFFNDYIELTILRVLDSSNDPEKEVQRASEICAGTAAAVLPSDQCLRVIKTVISTGDYPTNHSAIKMLTKLVEKHDKSVIINLLQEMMPPLIQAYDNPESAVRKAAVSCMVAIHLSVGDEVKPYWNSLNVSKMKLLKLYIDRKKSESSGTNSPVAAN